MGRMAPTIIEIHDDPNYHCDRHRFTSVGSYLLSHEEPFAGRFLAGAARPLRVLDSPWILVAASKRATP